MPKSCPNENWDNPKSEKTHCRHAASAYHSENKHISCDSTYLKKQRHQGSCGGNGWGDTGERQKCVPKVWGEMDKVSSYDEILKCCRNPTKHGSYDYGTTSDSKLCEVDMCSGNTGCDEPLTQYCAEQRERRETGLPWDPKCECIMEESIFSGYIDSNDEFLAPGAAACYINSCVQSAHDQYMTSTIYDTLYTAGCDVQVCIIDDINLNIGGAKIDTINIENDCDKNSNTDSTHEEHENVMQTEGPEGIVQTNNGNQDYTSTVIGAIALLTCAGCCVLMFVMSMK